MKPLIVAALLVATPTTSSPRKNRIVFINGSENEPLVVCVHNPKRIICDSFRNFINAMGSLRHPPTQE